MPSCKCILDRMVHNGTMTEKERDKILRNLKTDWIPVTERLPEDKQSVLVWCPKYKHIYCAYLDKEKWWIFGAFVQIVPNEVVAWMPLPKPYKEGAEE